MLLVQLVSVSQRQASLAEASMTVVSVGLAKANSELTAGASAENYYICDLRCESMSG